jgi:hypothetical protein
LIGGPGADGSVQRRGGSLQRRYRSPHSPEDLEAVRELFLAPEPEGDPVPLTLFSVSTLEQALDVTLPASATTMWKRAIVSTCG